MPRTKAPATTTLRKISRLSRANLAIMAAFVLVFASAGGLLVYHSEASTWSCAAHIYYQYEPGTYGGYCVKNIQQQLNMEIGAGLSQDGIFGPNTSYAVRSFNRNYVGRNLYVDNSTWVTSSTWSALCSWSYSSYRSLYNADDCAGGNYGRYYVGMIQKPASTYALAPAVRPKELA
jgi:hypothetical protein